MNQSSRPTSDALDAEEHPDLLALGDDVGKWMADPFR
jgi:hypothetical protein